VGCALGWYQGIAPQSRMIRMNLGASIRVVLGIVTVFALVSIVTSVAHKLGTKQEHKPFVEGFQYKPRQFKDGFF
jgi:hypothetical protein